MEDVKSGEFWYARPPGVEDAGLKACLVRDVTERTVLLEWSPVQTVLGPLQRVLVRYKRDEVDFIERTTDWS